MNKEELWRILKVLVECMEKYPGKRTKLKHLENDLSSQNLGGLEPIDIISQAIAMSIVGFDSAHRTVSLIEKD